MWRTVQLLSKGPGSDLNLQHNMAKWFIAHDIGFADAIDQD